MSRSDLVVHCAGVSDRNREAMGSSLGCEVRGEVPSAPNAGDVIVLGSGQASGTVPYGNVFSACRALKRSRGVRVFILVDHDDPFGVEIARYCMADAALRLGVDGEFVDSGRLPEWLAPHRPRASTDELLDRLEAEMAGDEKRRESAVQKIVEQAGDSSFLERLTDPETGLFDGPYAAFKLDEELKRSSRFHQPLSLLLIDCGVARWPDVDAERRTLLAEIASVFLNHCRDIDVLARFTETVFLCLLPGTGPDGAEVLAKRMLGELGEREFGVPAEMSPAVGIVTIPQPDLKDRQTLLARAEASLQLAQRGEGVGGVYAAGRGAGTQAIPE